MKPILFVLFFSTIFSSLMPTVSHADGHYDLSKLMVVDCLLPGQVRKLGSMTYIAARKAIKTSAADCEIRGGEYVAYDRATMASSLKVWLPLAKEGDAEAQNYVGEIYERGQGLNPDYASAATWYFEAAQQGNSRAAINLGQLFEKGLGLDKDPEMAAFWYQQASGIKGLTFKVKPDTKQVTEQKTDKPKETKITIVEPELTQKNDKYSTAWEGGKLLVIGEVESDIAVEKVMVNGVKAKLVGDSLFRIKVDPAKTGKTIKIIASTKKGKKNTFEFELNSSKTRKTQKQVSKPKTKIKKYGIKEYIKTVGNGKYYALVIGNNDYSAVPKLETAVRDATVVSQILKDEYGFITKLLVDADRYSILSEIYDIGKKIKPEDKFMIYYAGHGELDKINNRGHWLPVDADATNTVNWIPNISVTDMLNTLPSKQLIVVADSCYSGMMSRSSLGIIDQALSKEQRAKLLGVMTGAKTRTALSSGGVTPVIDSLDGRHSIFAISFLDVLRNNQGAMTGYEIFQIVVDSVKKQSESVGFSQIPEYAPLQFAGHEAGDFVFIKKNIRR